jgi:hypothetical protein
MKLNDLQKHEISEWTDEVENLLRSLSDKAQVWTDLHLENHLHFRKRYYNLIIPIIVLSSITGSANLALGSLPTSNSDSVVINLVIGVVGIVTSVLSTLNNIFSFQKRKDDHKRAADEWSRIHRIINIEINLARPRRNNVSTFLFLVLQEVERIFDTQPKLRTVIKKQWIRRYNLEQKKILKRNAVLGQNNATLANIIENELVELPEILLIKRTLVYRDSINSINQTPPTLPTNLLMRSDSSITEKKSPGLISKAIDIVKHRFNFSDPKDFTDNDSNNTSISNSHHDDSDHVIHIDLPVKTINTINTTNTTNANENTTQTTTENINDVAQILIDMTTSQ